MRLIAILQFLLANRELLRELYDLVVEIIAKFSGDNMGTFADGDLERLAAKYPALNASFANEASTMQIGDGFMELIEFLVNNADELADLIKQLLEQFGALNE